MPVNKISGQTGLLAPLTIGLAPGETFILPAGQGVLGTFGAQTQGFTGFTLSGQYLVNLGPYTSLQMLDSNLGLWRNLAPFGTGQPFVISSDGTNFRLANTTGCPVGMVVTNAGSGLTNGFNTCTITASTGGSTWATIVGGALATGIAVTGATINAGASYTKAPILVFNPPVGQNSPYVLPSAICSIASGTITSVTVLNQGAGLVAAPSLQILNAPGDTTGGGANLAANLSLASSGSLLVAFPTSFGTVGQLTAAPTFTFSPASSIAATAVMNFTVTGVTLTAAGAGFTSGTAFAIFSVGQVSGATAANSNPAFDTQVIMPRNVSIQGVAQGGAIQVTSQVAIHDGGFGFQAVPKLYIAGGITGGASATTAGLVIAGVGGVNDVSVIQPL